jgi:microcystin degradation protein MlrC
MKSILIVECFQEISSFNPLQSGFQDFTVKRGNAILAQHGLNTSMAGALSVFESEAVSVIPTISAWAISAGPLSAAGWKQLKSEVMEAVRSVQSQLDGVYFSLHGAMAAIDELDPEGALLSDIRDIVGDATPIVISLDLHGIMTDRMLRKIDGFAIYHTYPHVDFAMTGVRAARLLIELMNSDIRPRMIRVTIPALVRGDELITSSGYYGELVRECQRLEQSGAALSAGLMIGNPFTDVPELCSQVLLMENARGDSLVDDAVRIAKDFWSGRARMQGHFISIDAALEESERTPGTVVFTDAADATSSGATGDSNYILRAALEKGYSKRLLAQIVDAPAARQAHAAGVGAIINVTLGGTCDPGRFTPMPVTARVRLLSDGRAYMETMGDLLDAGPSAVLEIGNVTVVVLSNPIYLFDRALYFSNGCNPEKYDAVVVKSPHVEHHMYDAWIEKNFNVDGPGSSSANLRSLGHRICMRPIFPLDENVEFLAAPAIYRRGLVESQCR